MNTQKTRISRISNNIFLIMSVMVLSFIWINFHLRNMNDSVILAFLLTIMFCFIYFPINTSLYKKNQSKNNSGKEKEFIRTQLLLGKYKDIIPTLCHAFKLTELQSTSQEFHFIDSQNDIDIYFLFENTHLTESDIIKVYKTKTYKNIKIFCIEAIPFPPDHNCKIDIITIDKIHESLSSNNIKLNTNIIIDKKPKFSIKDILRIVFNAKKSKSYFWFGIMLIFTSLFTPFQIYYIVSGTILILLSIFSRFNKTFN